MLSSVGGSRANADQWARLDDEPVDCADDHRHDDARHVGERGDHLTERLHARPRIQLIASATERVSTRRTSPSGTVREEASRTTASSAAGASAIVAASVSTTTAG